MQGRSSLGRGKEIEAELGKLLKWDESLRLWVGKKFVKTLEEIHRIIKEEFPNKLVLYWQHTGYATLDDIGFLLPKGAPLSTPGLYWYRYSDIIKPGLCDGFMAYPNNQKVWEQKYMRHVRRHGWLFFSQLSHPGRMRLQPWPEAVRMVKVRMPQNLGYFFYCEGDCAADKRWNDDFAIPPHPEWNLRMASIPLHMRLFAAKEGIGMDVVRRHLRLEVLLDVPAEGVRPGELLHVVAVVRNRKEPSYFPRPKGGGSKKGRSENLCLGSLSAPRGGVGPLGSEAGRHTPAEPSFRRLVAEGVKLLKARLFATDLMGASPKEFADPSDPTGFRCFKEGYVVWGKYVDKYLKSGARYRKGLWARLRRMVTARFGSAAATEEGKYGSKAPSGTLFPRSWGKPQPS